MAWQATLPPLLSLGYDLIICAHSINCDTYDIVANCNIMLTNKVKNKDIMLYKWFRLI